MKKVFKEHFSRSFAKALSFRLLVIVSNVLIIFIVTGEMRFVFGVILISTVVNTILYVIHERIWDRIKWGRNGR